MQRRIVDNRAIAVEYESFAVGRCLPVHVRPSALAVADDIWSACIGFFNIVERNMKIFINIFLISN